MIYAKKETGALTIFTQAVWDELGKNKGGWEQITKAQYEALRDGKEVPVEKVSQAGREAQGAVEYKALRARAEGLEKDGDKEGALVLYKQVLGIKHTKGVENKIAKLEADLVANKEKVEQRAALVQSGNDAFDLEDFETAKEFYLSANLILESEEITAKIAECDAKLEVPDSEENS